MKLIYPLLILLIFNYTFVDVNGTNLIGWIGNFFGWISKAGGWLSKAKPIGSKGGKLVIKYVCIFLAVVMYIFNSI